MAKLQRSTQRENDASSSERLALAASIAQKHTSHPSPRALLQNGQIHPQACEQAERVRASGPPARPFRELIRALRAERERQGLSLADLAKRTGMDRAAIHKLEIGLNSNPTYATLTRYAQALGGRIEWKLKTVTRKPIGA